MGFSALARVRNSTTSGKTNNNTHIYKKEALMAKNVVFYEKSTVMLIRVSLLVTGNVVLFKWDLQLFMLSRPRNTFCFKRVVLTACTHQTETDRERHRETDRQRHRVTETWCQLFTWRRSSSHMLDKEKGGEPTEETKTGDLINAKKSESVHSPCCCCCRVPVLPVIPVFQQGQE